MEVRVQELPLVVELAEVEMEVHPLQQLVITLQIILVVEAELVPDKLVEMADQGMAQGLQAAPAALQTAQARLRPILMTSTASLAGFFPPVVARNAGANAQQSIGTVVFGGLLLGTILSLAVVPSVYVFIKNWESRWFNARRAAKPSL